MDKRNLIISPAAPIQLTEGHYKLMLELRREKGRMEDKVRAQSFAKVSPLLLSAPSRTLDSSNSVRNQMAELERKASKSFVKKRDSQWYPCFYFTCPCWRDL